MISTKVRAKLFETNSSSSNVFAFTLTEPDDVELRKNSQKILEGFPSIRRACLLVTAYYMSILDVSTIDKLTRKRKPTKNLYDKRGISYRINLDKFVTKSEYKKLYEIFRFIKDTKTYLENNEKLQDELFSFHGFTSTYEYLQATGFSNKKELRELDISVEVVIKRVDGEHIDFSFRRNGEEFLGYKLNPREYDEKYLECLLDYPPVGKEIRAKAKVLMFDGDEDKIDFTWVLTLGVHSDDNNRKKRRVAKKALIYNALLKALAFEDEEETISNSEYYTFLPKSDYSFVYDLSGALKEIKRVYGDEIDLDDVKYVGRVVVNGPALPLKILSMRLDDVPEASLAFLTFEDGFDELILARKTKNGEVIVLVV